MTDLRRRVPFPLNTDNVAGTPVSSDAASDGDALVYNSTTGYYDLTGIISGGGGNVTGNKTFTGGFKVGANGTVFTEIRRGVVEITGINLLVGQTSIGSIPIPAPPMSATPIVQLTIESNTGAASNNDSGLMLLVAGTPTTTSIHFTLANRGDSTTTGNFRFHWIAYVLA